MDRHVLVRPTNSSTWYAGKSRARRSVIRTDSRPSNLRFRPAPRPLSKFNLRVPTALPSPQILQPRRVYRPNAPRCAAKFPATPSSPSPRPSRAFHSPPPTIPTNSIRPTIAPPNAANCSVSWAPSPTMRSRARPAPSFYQTISPICSDDPRLCPRLCPDTSRASRPIMHRPCAGKRPSSSVLDIRIIEI